MDAKLMGEGLVGAVVCLLFYLIFDQMGKIQGLEIADTFKWVMVLLAIFCVIVSGFAIFKDN